MEGWKQEQGPLDRREALGELRKHFESAQTFDDVRTALENSRLHEHDKEWILTQVNELERMSAHATMPTIGIALVESQIPEDGGLQEEVRRIRYDTYPQTIAIHVEDEDLEREHASREAILRKRAAEYSALLQAKFPEPWEGRIDIQHEDTALLERLNTICDKWIEELVNLERNPEAHGTFDIVLANEVVDVLHALIRSGSSAATPYADDPLRVFDTPGFGRIVPPEMGEYARRIAYDVVRASLEEKQEEN